jgi:glyoxalase family protein
MNVLGLHHITLVSSNAQRTVDFYVKVLGLRFVKQTVNFDDPSAYHLYFGDATGSPGSAITFFEWAHAGRHRHGIGGTHHLALRVPTYEGLLKWKRRLTDLGIAVNGPLDRNYFKSLYFTDPDGVILEIATDGPGWTVDESEALIGTSFQAPPEAMLVANRDREAIENTTWGEPVPTITADMALMHGMHHITAISSNIERTHDYLSGVLGLRRVKMTANFDDPTSAHWYWGAENGKPGTIITYFERDPRKTPRAVVGVGSTHHFAFAVADEEAQTYFRERLMAHGYRVSPITNRDYFKSIYTTDPDGHIVEMATVGPGFAIDEDVETLGQTLQLPEWLRPHREQIERGLTPLVVPAWRMPESE